LQGLKCGEADPAGVDMEIDLNAVEICGKGVAGCLDGNHLPMTEVNPDGENCIYPVSALCPASRPAARTYPPVSPVSAGGSLFMVY
jgi:hypothetical protein